MEKIDNPLSNDEEKRLAKEKKNSLRIARAKDLPSLHDLQPTHFDYIYNIDDLIIRKISIENVSEEE